jgi:ribosomal protein L11 methyltransferase
LETRNNTYICYTLRIEKARQHELIDFFDAVFFDTNYQIMSDVVEADIDVSHGTIYADALDCLADFSVRFYIERADEASTRTKLQGVPADVTVISEAITFSVDEATAEYKQPFMLTDTCAITFDRVLASDQKKGTEIVLQPKNAFGTGSHSSTRIAAQLIEQYGEMDDVMLDVGTGTGILAIYGAKRGLRYVLAIDSDEVSVLEATMNADVNGVSERVEIKQNDFLTNIDLQPFTLIVANLSLNLYPQFLNALQAKMQPQQRFIFSGVMAHEAATFEGFFAELGLVLHDKKVEDAWVGYYVRNSK